MVLVCMLAVYHLLSRMGKEEGVCYWHEVMGMCNTFLAMGKGGGGVTDMKFMDMHNTFLAMGEGGWGYWHEIYGHV